MKLPSINWKVYAPVILAILFSVLFLWVMKGIVDDRREKEREREARIFSTDKRWCNRDTVLVDFVFHPGIVRRATLEMENGDKFLYRCKDRHLDVCNHLERGMKVCYDHPVHNEVLKGHTR